VHWRERERQGVVLQICQCTGMKGATVINHDDFFCKIIFNFGIGYSNILGDGLDLFRTFSTRGKRKTTQNPFQ